MTYLALFAAVVAGIVLARVGAVREKAQSGNLKKLERKVADLCSAEPWLAWTAGLRPEHFLHVEPPSVRRPAGRPAQVPRRALVLAAALREEARERGPDAVYLPNVMTGRESAAATVAVSIAGAQAILAAQGSGTLPVAAVAVLAAVAALLTYVDCRTYLIDLPVALGGAATVVALSAAGEYLAEGSMRGTGYAILASAAAAALYSALGSAALLLRRAREGTSSYTIASAMLVSVLLALFAPYVVAVRSILQGGAHPVAWIASVAPLALAAAAGRYVVGRGNITFGKDGRIRVAEGPTAGVGDGDLILMPLVVVVPYVTVGPAALPLLLGIPALIALVTMALRSLLRRGGSAAPLPFAPALLAAALIVIALAPRIPPLP